MSAAHTSPWPAAAAVVGGGQEMVPQSTRRRFHHLFSLLSRSLCPTHQSSRGSTTPGRRRRWRLHRGTSRRCCMRLWLRAAPSSGPAVVPFGARTGRSWASASRASHPFFPRSGGILPARRRFFSRATAVVAAVESPSRVRSLPSPTLLLGLGFLCFCSSRVPASRRRHVSGGENR